MNKIKKRITDFTGEGIKMSCTVRWGDDFKIVPSVDEDSENLRED